jgi:hypothetical protein
MYIEHNFCPASVKHLDSLYAITLNESCLTVGSLFRNTNLFKKDCLGSGKNVHNCYPEENGRVMLFQLRQKLHFPLLAPTVKFQSLSVVLNAFESYICLFVDLSSGSHYWPYQQSTAMVGYSYIYRRCNSEWTFHLSLYIGYFPSSFVCKNPP